MRNTEIVGFILLIAFMFLVNGCIATGSIIQTDDIYDASGDNVIGQQRIEIRKTTGPWVKDITLHEVWLKQNTDGSYEIKTGQRITSETQESAATILNNLINRIPVPMGASVITN